MADNVQPHHLYATNPKIVHKVVLTGGPCGGKTTGQIRLSTFFENLGWKVFRVPETATLLMSGGVKWTDLSPEQADEFQYNLIKTMMQIEQTYFDLAEMSSYNCLVICDRGVMDPSAYMPNESWRNLISKESWNNIDLRDNRYSQVIHMVTAAKGAEDFYTCEEHTVRYESPEQARELDDKVAQAWLGHPYYDVVDNSTNFNTKVIRMIEAVCLRTGINIADRLSINSKKRKFLVNKCSPDEYWTPFAEFDVVHNYLITPNDNMQARIRKRGKDEHYTYTHTIRRPQIKGQRVELRKQIGARTYQMLIAQKDVDRHTIYKKRRCFVWNNRYFQLDVYQEPCHSRCRGLMILETYTTESANISLPSFLDIECEITDQPMYSMYNLSLKDYHPAEKKAGITNSSEQLDFRSAYANIASNADDYILKNGFH